MDQNAGNFSTDFPPQSMELLDTQVEDLALDANNRVYEDIDCDNDGDTISLT